MLDSILTDRDLVVDWVKFSTMFVVSRLLVGGDLGDQQWMMGCLYTLLGFTAYHMVTKKMIPNNAENETMRRVIDTCFKVGTMLVVSRLLSGQPLDEAWMMSSLFTMLGFTTYDAVLYDLIPLDGIENDAMRNVVVDGLTVGSMSVVSTLLAGGELNQEMMTTSLYTFLGFAAYDLGTSNLLN